MDFGFMSQNRFRMLATCIGYYSERTLIS